MENPFKEKPVTGLESEIRKIVRDEIRKAFRAMAEEADSRPGEDVIESSALTMIARTVRGTSESLFEEEEA
jgi:hypothetical protein